MGLFAQQLNHLVSASFAVGVAVFVFGCASEPPQRSTGQSIDDQATSSRIQTALSEDPAYKYTEVKVTTFQGKVQLSGFVDNNEQKDRATEIAKKTKGVKDVNNSIELK